MSLEAIKQMVRYGLGIGVIPTAAIASPPQNTIARSIVELDLKLPVGIVFHSEVNFPGSALHSLVSDENIYPFVV
jgi:LysR family transcriptional regulator, regulator of the ytmI operon